MAVGDLGMGLITFSVGGVTLLGEGSAGCEGDVAFGKAVGYTAPFDAKLINKQFYIKGTAQEIAGATLGIIWGDTYTGMGASSVSVNPSDITAIATFPQGTFTMTSTSVACDFGEISGGESDTTSVTFTFKGYSKSGAAQVVWADT